MLPRPWTNIPALTIALPTCRNTFFCSIKVVSGFVLLLLPAPLPGNDVAQQVNHSRKARNRCREVKVQVAEAHRRTGEGLSQQGHGSVFEFVAACRKVRGTARTPRTPPPGALSLHRPPLSKGGVGVTPRLPGKCAPYVVDEHGRPFRLGLLGANGSGPRSRGEIKVTSMATCAPPHTERTEATT